MNVFSTSVINPAQSPTATSRTADSLSAAEPETTSGERDAVAEFSRYMAMSPAEKIRYAVLAEMDMTVEEYEALPPEQKAEIDEEIAERLRDYQEARSWSRALPEGVNQYRLEQLRAGQDDDDQAPGVFV